MKALTASAAALFAALTLLVIAASASAAFPGENGRLALLWTYSPPADVSTDVILTANAGTGGMDDQVTFCDYGCHTNSPDWSPNGRRLAFVLQRFEDDLPRLVTARPGGTDLELVYSNRRFYLRSAAWAPDGLHIAFVAYRYSAAAGKWISDIFVIRRNGTHLTRLTNTPRLLEDNLDWSSASRLVFRSQLRAPLRTKHYELFSMRPDGSHLHQLTSNDISDDEPDFAPGGKRMVFVRGLHQIWTIGLWGKNASMVAEGRDPAWAPDGSRIAYVGPDGAIHTIKPSGQDDVLVGTPVTEGSISELDWRSR